MLHLHNLGLIPLKCKVLEGCLETAPDCYNILPVLAIQY